MVRKMLARSGKPKLSHLPKFAKYEHRQNTAVIVGERETVPFDLAPVREVAVRVAGGGRLTREDANK